MKKSIKIISKKSNTVSSNLITKEDLKIELHGFATKQDLIDQTERVLTAFESVTVDLQKLVGDVHTTHYQKYQELDSRITRLEAKI